MRRTITAVGAALALGAMTMTGAMAAGPNGMSRGTHMGMHNFSGARGGGFASGEHGGRFAEGGHGGRFAEGGHGGRFAEGGHGGRFAEGGHGGRFDHRGIGAGIGAGFGLFAFGGNPDYYDYDSGYDSCWVRRLVPTRYGLRWRLVDVCY